MQPIKAVDKSGNVVLPFPISRGQLLVMEVRVRGYMSFPAMKV